MTKLSVLFVAVVFLAICVSVSADRHAQYEATALCMDLKSNRHAYQEFHTPYEKKPTASNSEQVSFSMSALPFSKYKCTVIVAEGKVTTGDVVHDWGN